MNDETNKARKISIGGIASALISVLLFLTAIFTFNKLSILAVTSLIIGAVIIEGGFITAMTAYAASSILSFLIIPNKAIAFGFILLAGVYPLIRHGTEHINNFYIRWAAKIISANIMVGSLYLIAKSIFGMITDVPLWVFIITFQLVFIAGDFIYGKALNYYSEKLGKRLFNNER